jgi:hypothetical protein
MMWISAIANGPRPVPHLALAPKLWRNPAGAELTTTDPGDFQRSRLDALCVIYLETVYRVLPVPTTVIHESLLRSINYCNKAQH